MWLFYWLLTSAVLMLNHHHRYDTWEVNENFLESKGIKVRDNNQASRLPSVLTLDCKINSPSSLWPRSEMLFWPQRIIVLIIGISRLRFSIFSIFYFVNNISSTPLDFFSNIEINLSAATILSLWYLFVLCRLINPSPPSNLPYCWQGERTKCPSWATPPSRANKTHGTQNKPALDKEYTSHSLFSSRWFRRKNLFWMVFFVLRSVKGHLKFLSGEKCCVNSR